LCEPRKTRSLSARGWSHPLFIQRFQQKLQTIPKLSSQPKWDARIPVNAAAWSPLTLNLPDDAGLDGLCSFAPGDF